MPGMSAGGRARTPTISPITLVGGGASPAWSCEGETGVGSDGHAGLGDHAGATVASDGTDVGGAGSGWAASSRTSPGA